MPILFADLASGAQPAMDGIIADFTGFFEGQFGSGGTFFSMFISIAGLFLGYWLIRFLLRLVKGIASAGK